jgi:hypothetical protein
MRGAVVRLAGLQRVCGPRANAKASHIAQRLSKARRNPHGEHIDPSRRSRIGDRDSSVWLPDALGSGEADRIAAPRQDFGSGARLLLPLRSTPFRYSFEQVPSSRSARRS